MFNLLADAVHFGGVGAFVGKGPLGDDAATVQVGIHPMDGDAIHLYAKGDGLLHRMRPPESGQERRVDVDDLAVVGLQQGVPTMRI